MGPESTIARVIRHARREAGMTLEDVAEQVGVTPGALSHIESGRRLPNPRNAVRIAQVLGLDPQLLLSALDTAHSARRMSRAYDSLPPQSLAAASVPTPEARSFSETYLERPIEELFGGVVRSGSEPLDSQTHQRYAMAPEPPDALDEERAVEPARDLRTRARFSDDTPTRLEALDQLADTASDAIRTLRGLLQDDDPLVSREARRLLRELDVRLPEERDHW